MTSTTGPRDSDPLAASGPGPRHRAGDGAAGGFTLMELVLVLVVISAVLALSAPSLRGFFASRQTADAAVSMVSLTKWAQSHAVTQGCPVRLNIDVASGTYWLTVQEAGAFVEPSSGIGRQHRLPEGAAVTVQSEWLGPDPGYLLFDPTGRHDVATIEITGMQGERYQVVAPSAVEPYRVISPAEAP